MGAWLSVLTAISVVSSDVGLHHRRQRHRRARVDLRLELGSGQRFRPASPAIYGTRGSASAANRPGARGYHHLFYEPSGTLWLFGGHGFDSTGATDELNDLWKYNTASHEWTWVSGSNLASGLGTYGTKGTAAPANVPGARDSCGSWRDSSGRLWIFGGFGYDATGTDDSTLNDLWMFNPATNQWAWMSGSMNADQTGIYGTKGTADPANVPGARYRPASWLGSDGDLWLFGGYGRDAIGQVGELNDLWKFDPATLEWTWVSGSEVRDQPGVYGTKGTAAPANVPGARDASVSWLDAAGKVWLFGGEGHGAAVLIGQLNDLWKYDPATNQWTWISGDNTVDHAGVFGTMGTAAASNNPGGNRGAAGWVDPTGKLWLFGGTGYDAVGTLGMLNDLWKFDPGDGAMDVDRGQQDVQPPGHLRGPGQAVSVQQSRRPGPLRHLDQCERRIVALRRGRIRFRRPEELYQRHVEVRPIGS
ncbi:MAG: galactose oxidase [Candidatus Moduliflexus flocculans]|nr:galactose oxidase [Candidatus Moduliflexus flocculans]